MKNQMKTKVWYVDKDVEEAEICAQVVDAAQLIQNLEVVAFPTETVYGLGANALSDEAVEKIFTAKGRPSDNPLIVHIADREQLAEVVAEVPTVAEQLIQAFWPGPLTLVLPKKEQVAARVAAGLSTVGVRMPDHPVALAFIRQAGVPLAAPSANRSGRPSPTSGQHVLTDLAGRIAGLIDSGPTGVGVESTVLDVSVNPPMILRPGGITHEQLTAIIGEVAIDPTIRLNHVENLSLQPRSPGMKYTHYAPAGELWLVSGEADQVRQQMVQMLQQAKQSGQKTGVLCTDETLAEWEDLPFVDAALPMGPQADMTLIARNLYAVLRQCDELNLNFIVSPTFPPAGMGFAVMNRLEKASGGRIVQAT